MPILIAVAIATVVVAVVLALVARSGQARDAAEVRGDTQPLVPHLLVAEARKHPPFRRFLMQRTDPTKATGLVLTVALIVFAGAAVTVGVVLELVQRNVGFARWDESAARWGAEHATDTSTDVLRIVTYLGSTPGVIILAVIVGVIEYRRIPTRAVPAFLAAVILSELIINNVTKLIVTRERPDFARLAGHAGWSFPSGHSAAAAAAYAAFALVIGRRRSLRTRALLAGTAGAVAIAVATSRVLLGVHWVTDVMAGVALGWGCFALCSIAFGGRLLRFGEPIEEAQAEVAHETASSPRSTSESNMTGSSPMRSI